MRRTIAVAGVGNVGKYLCEELLHDDRYDLVVLSRKRDQWLTDHNITVYETDYDQNSVLDILNSTDAYALISLINCPHNCYVNIHTTLLNACMKSSSCKRFIPSEFAGNIDDYPLLPNFYGSSREPFRKILERSTGVEWTLFNQGWLMDYFLPKGKTHMPPIPDEFPIDPNGWKACIRGTGDEPQSFTCGRNVGQALVELLEVQNWEPHTYVTGDWSTFNEAVGIVEKHFGRPLPKTYKLAKEIMDAIAKHSGDVTPQMELAWVEEWMISGAPACPRERVIDQREKYFRKVKFFTIQELLKLANTKDFI